ncbi:hypothetical protein GCM10010270_02780 [Streptomyces violaceus]|nr:hypothetical protein GCM10010270_02780 [Streptomyces janthinus]
MSAVGVRAAALSGISVDRVRLRPGPEVGLGLAVGAAARDLGRRVLFVTPCGQGRQGLPGLFRGPVVQVELAVLAAVWISRKAFADAEAWAVRWGALTVVRTAPRPEEIRARMPAAVPRLDPAHAP